MIEQRVTDTDSLAPELVDLISESMVWTNDAAARADILADIIQCAVDAVRWRLEPAGNILEECSLHQLMRAAGRHRVRMAAQPGRSAGVDATAPPAATDTPSTASPPPRRRQASASTSP